MRFCANAQPSHWTEIPAVPVALYRDFAALLLFFEPDLTQVLFRTSGTTGDVGSASFCNFGALAVYGPSGMRSMVERV